jgi:hypothetical protein
VLVRVVWVDCAFRQDDLEQPHERQHTTFDIECNWDWDMEKCQMDRPVFFSIFSNTRFGAINDSRFVKHLLTLLIHSVMKINNKKFIESNP